MDHEKKSGSSFITDKNENLGVHFGGERKCVEKCVIDWEPEFGSLVVYREYTFFIIIYLSIKILKLQQIGRKLELELFEEICLKIQFKMREFASK